MAKFGISACISGLIPSFFDDLGNKGLAASFAAEEVRKKISLDISHVFRNDQVEIVHNLSSVFLSLVKRLFSFPFKFF